MTRLRGIFVALSLSFACLAQVERATIVGTVTDKSGAALPGVTVQVIHESTNTTVTLQTDAAGEYTASNLTPGSYTIEVEKPGFTKHVNRNFVVQVAQIARLDVTLDVGAVEQTVEVRSEAPILQTENASVGQVIGSQPINELPLNGRNFAQLAILAPGVSGLSYAPAATINAGARPDELRPGGTTIEANGARDSANKMLLDGADNTEMIAQTFVVRPDVEGIQEFKVLTNNAGAEFNRGGGAVIVTSTKAGTNQLHGSLFEFLRNSDLDSKNYFDRKTAPIPPYRLNNFGASVGAPIRRNKTFFFADYEGYYERLGETLVNTVPTAAMKQGNFQGFGTIYDPLTTQQVGSNYVRQPFANNIIPASRFDPIAAQIVALYPLPQTSALANNYVSSPSKQTDNDRADLRIDHQITSNQNLFGRYSIDNSRIVQPNTFDNAIGGNENAFSGPDAIVGQNAVLAYNNIISPTVVGEYRLGFTKFKNFLLTSPLTSPVWSQIPGRDTSDPFQPSAPIISPAGYAGLGDSRSEPLIRREHNIENIGSITWLHRSHSFKFGIDMLHREISETATPPSQSAFGRFNFDNGFTDNPQSAGNTGNAIASMLLGYPTNTTRDFFLPGTADLIANEYNFYMRDDWRVSKKLTLNLGVHYEINTPFRETHNAWGNINAVTGQVLIAGKNASSTADVNTQYNAIGPRFGFAYAIDNKTVLRGGYGIFYDPQGAAGTTIRQERQWPFDLIYSIVPGALFTQNTVSQGFVKVSDLPAGTFSSPFGTLKGIDENFKNASTQQFNFGIQRQLTATSSLSVSYVGALGRHLSWALPLDQPAPGPGAIQARRPFNALYPNVTAITFLESTGTSSYNSLQTTFEKRLSSGLYFTATWVYSHSLDDASYDGGADGPVPQDPTNRRADWANSDSDVRHRVTIYGTYELPIGPGKRWLKGDSAWNRYAVGGWQLNAINFMQSGQPFTVVTTGSPTNTGVAGRANVVSGTPQYPASQSVNEWFNPAAFTFPTAYNWGNAGRNILLGPDSVNFDVTAVKKFQITESKTVMFRAEFFNVFNHPQFTLPAATIGAAGVGTISATARSSRQIQFALKFMF
jgi:hypothetical protein